MSGEQLIGELAQAALDARALEPGHGEADPGHTHETRCLNCDADLLGGYCHRCGQAAHVHRTLAAFFHDLLHGVFHFEGKIWRTLPRLVWQPGRLTRDYIDGRRASYVSPIALFLFAVFLLFAVGRQLGGNLDDLARLDAEGLRSQGAAGNAAALVALRQQRAVLAAQGQPTAGIDTAIRQSERAATAIGAPGAKTESLDTGFAPLDHVVRAFRANPSLALYKLQSNAYKYSWALIPISVPLVWLLFPFSRRFHLYDHTVFVTYSLCFMSLLAVALMLANALGAPLIGLAAVLAPPMHMFRQLRGAYGIGRLSALWRTAALLLIASGALTLFTLLLLAESGA